jgi:hypothetical protein
MPTQATYDDANLILRLFELRREELMRKARQWFSANFNATNMEEAMRIAPPGSQESAYMRMVVSYWETAASFVASGVLNQELFFQSSGEMLGVWERMRPLVPGMREMSKNPASFRNLETVGNAYIKWMEANGPEAYPTFQNMMKMMAGGATAAAGKKA